MTSDTMPDLPDLLAEASRSVVLSELTEQAEPEPTPADTPAQIAADLAALQIRVAALTTTTSTTTKGLL
jgi:hypothetical protein